MNQITKLWRGFRGTVRGVDSCSQLSWGVVLGMLIGLLPKDSLLPYVLLVVLLLSKANLLTAGCSAVVFHWISPLLDPLTNAIGIGILTVDVLEPIWGWLIQLPLVAWTRFDNTVVMGTLVTGLIAAVPVYRLSFKFFEAFGTTLYTILRNTRLAHWFVGNPETDLIKG